MADPLSVAIAAAVAHALEPVLEQLAELRRHLEAPAAPPALVDRRGLARELGVSVATVDRLRAEGAPELRVGDAPRFRVGDVVDWLRGRGTR